MEVFIPWNAGKVEAVGYIGGSEVCRQEYKTAKSASQLSIEAKELGEGIVKVTAKAVDEDGLFCFGYNKKITFSSDGNFELLAVDNGDLTDHTPYTDNTRNTLNGMCTAFYRVGDTSEKCMISAVTEDGFETGVLGLKEIIVTGKQRMITALEGGKPDRLPVTTHHILDYFRNTYLDGRSSDEFFAEFGLDPIVWTVPHTFAKGNGEYFDPAQKSLGFLESKRVLSDNWRIEQQDLSDSKLQRTRYSFITPKKDSAYDCGNR